MGVLWRCDYLYQSAGVKLVMSELCQDYVMTMLRPCLNFVSTIEKTGIDNKEQFRMKT